MRAADIHTEIMGSDHCPVSLTLDEVTKRPDGTVRFILCDKDPGLPNWIETFHHNRGFLIMRMVRVDTNPVPTITKTPEKRVLAPTDLHPAALPAAPSVAKTTSDWPGFRGPERDSP